MQEVDQRMGVAVNVIRKQRGVISTSQISGLLGPKRKADEDLVNLAADAEKLLTRLKPSCQAHANITWCMSGTRRDILAQITTWLNSDEPDASKIFWLGEFPGVSKTAIVSTLVAELATTGRLISSFFFERDNTSHTTVAFHLARLYPSARNVIIAKLRADEGIPHTADTQKLFRDYIEEPPMTIKETIPGGRPVIIVDALDECGGCDRDRLGQQRKLLETLRLWSSLSAASGFKLVVTGRAEHNIVAALQPISLYTEIQTGITVTESSSDIHFYLHQRFAEIAEAHPCSIVTPWPEPAILLTLTNQAAGLFIWAKTVVALVDQSNPPNQLDRILRGDLGDADMDKLYELMQRGVGRQPDAGALERFNSVTAAIVLAKVPLRREDLSRILGNSTTSLSLSMHSNRS